MQSEIAMRNFILMIALITIQLTNFVSSSTGDKSPYYHNCVNNCIKQTCQNNILLFKKGMEDSISDHLIDLWRYKNLDISTFELLENLIGWNCRDECKYQCMHKTTQAFIARKWAIPQFHGKWPFIRFLGMQEPASVIFSALNFFVHYKGLQKFRKDVPSDAPHYKLWHTFSVICLNAWTWSMVFHARDYPLTELFDYVFAYSMVLASFCCMFIRVAHGKTNRLKAFITLLCIGFFLNHFAYLSYNSFDYSYNMKVNIVTGVFGGFGWIIWCCTQMKRRPYVWKMLLFVLLAICSIILEVYDFPPFLNALDAHSLWHLSSAPITILFYKFITDDCKALRREITTDDDKEKLL